MNGIMMGLTPREARKRYESVIEFAELKEFEELKLKNYSSGMHVRLAFSVAIQVDAEILLIDEVLAVGDAAFQQKCFDVFHRMRDEGKTIVFVTHDMGALNRFCDRAMLLEQGSMVELGEPQEVGDRYLEINFGRDSGTAVSGAVDDSGEARVLEVWVENDRGERLNAVPQGERITLSGLVAFNVEVEDPQAAVYVLNEDHRATVVASTAARATTNGPIRARRPGVCSRSRSTTCWRPAATTRCSRSRSKDSASTSSIASKARSRSWSRRRSRRAVSSTFRSQVGVRRLAAANQGRPRPRGSSARPCRSIQT